MRALGLIRDGEAEAAIEVGGLVRTVKLWRMRFPNGGSWSFFICPNCARRCKTLRLYDGKLMCARCDGLLLRCQSAPGALKHGDKQGRIERLRELLARPSLHWRKKIETALRRALIVERQRRAETWAKARDKAKRSILRGSKPRSSKHAAT